MATAKNTKSKATENNKEQAVEKVQTKVTKKKDARIPLDVEVPTYLYKYKGWWYECGVV